MRTTLKSIAAIVACFAGLSVHESRAADPFLNTSWRTTYTTEQGANVDSQVNLTGNGAGTYQASANGQALGNGTFSQVRVESETRQNSPLPGPGSGGNNFGLPSNETKYIKGLWDFNGTKGWFKWELYEAGGGCHFVGKWGFLENGAAGPTKGSWRGDQTNGGGGSSGGGNSPLIPIP